MRIWRGGVCSCEVLYGEACVGFCPCIHGKRGVLLEYGLYLYNVRTMMKAIHDLVPDYRDSLTEAIGLSLPGNGTILATHANRIRLFQDAAKLVVENAFKYYEEGDESVLPKSIATRQAFLNAMTLDIAMGGSSNTVLHLLAVANEAGVDFKMADIDALSRKVPCLCKLAPNTQKYSIQECNRAGGILNILGELQRPVCWIRRAAG